MALTKGKKNRIIDQRVIKQKGPDDLSSRFLKEVASEIAEPLTSLFNYSLQEKVVPSPWKRSHITPVLKVGASDDPSNYFPIAVVPVVAKVLEKIVSTQLSIYLERNNLLHPHRGALLLAVDWIALSLDKGNVVCAAFIGLRKAIDSLDHGLLLQRIFELGVHGTIVAEADPGFSEGGV